VYDQGAVVQSIIDAKADLVCTGNVRGEDDVVHVRGGDGGGASRRTGHDEPMARQRLTAVLVGGGAPKSAGRPESSEAGTVKAAVGSYSRGWSGVRSGQHARSGGEDTV